MKEITGLPSEVLRRIGESRRSLLDLGVVAPVSRNNGTFTALYEARRIGRLEELREAEVPGEMPEDPEDEFGVRGYAAVVEQPYPVAGGKESGWGWDETIAAGAFDRALGEAQDVRFLLNHDGVPMARTKSGTLALWADNIGLGMECSSLDDGNPDVCRLRSAVRRGDMDQMSFAFRVIRQEWNGDYTERRILDLDLYDVAAVTFPANEATVIGERQSAVPAARAMSLALARAIADGARAHRVPA